MPRNVRRPAATVGTCPAPLRSVSPAPLNVQPAVSRLMTPPFFTVRSSDAPFSQCSRSLYPRPATVRTSALTPRIRPTWSDATHPVEERDRASTTSCPRNGFLRGDHAGWSGSKVKSRRAGECRSSCCASHIGAESTGRSPVQTNFGLIKTSHDPSSVSPKAWGSFWDG